MALTLTSGDLAHLTLDELAEHVDLIEYELEEARAASDDAAEAEDPDAWDDAEILVEDLEVKLTALHDAIDAHTEVTR